VFAPDIARGQLAAVTSHVGSRDILCDRYVPFGELAELISRLTGSHHPPQLPPLLARIVSRLTETASRLTNRAPLLAAGQLPMTSRHQPDPTRAHTELGWTPTPLADAVRITITGQRRTSTSRHGGTR
jgi:dihydroflavonol-4-reductase